ncbi:hypothetical protein JMJ77_0010940 [Colletotrichum scovillei]|uniref:Uncharacterized protein n=1 Tax=Colletotrichum scovillei TaxID=1209932 RepID=A0A9P7R2I7_9PEZI|nr:hypothetical protein JMJ77_0010940 [Colletotrichum scovillei]KAG7059937.1 hypothetical protein JMJ78_0015221 [Colletotrichum scovillei]KAG7067357.1 hypothetical protein JMJ76_0008796 [Colletotrichum scovillei]
MTKTVLPECEIVLHGRRKARDSANLMWNPERGEPVVMIPRRSPRRHSTSTLPCTYFYFFYRDGVKRVEPSLVR